VKYCSHCICFICTLCTFHIVWTYTLIDLDKLLDTWVLLSRLAVHNSSETNQKPARQNNYVNLIRIDYSLLYFHYTLTIEINDNKSLKAVNSLLELEVEVFLKETRVFFYINKSRILKRSLKPLARISNIKLSQWILYFFGGSCILRPTIPKDPVGSFMMPFPENSITVAARDPFGRIQRRYFAQTCVTPRLTWSPEEKSINTEYCVVI